MIRLDVVGVPAPQGSKTRMPNGAMIDGSSKTGRQKLASWRDAVGNAARAWVQEHHAQPLDEPVRLKITFRFPLTKGDPYRTLHTTKPDLDKIERSTLDALVLGGMLRDDSLVCEVWKAKVYAHDEPVGATILIEGVGHIEAGHREALKQQAAVSRRRLTDVRQAVLL